MIDDVLGVVRCPHCGEGLARVAGSRAIGCASGHTFDVARQGYVNLLAGDARTTTADSAAMVAAREAFLGAGHLSPVADAVARAAGRAVGGEGVEGVEGVVLEIGAGTGYHLARTLDALPGRAGLALDLSKHAARRAARAHPRIGAVVCDAWEALPVASGAVAVALDVFAPRNAPELARVLAPGGGLVVVTPTPRHLRELLDADRGPCGARMLTVDERKEERLEARLGGWFDTTTAEESFVEYAVTLTPAEAAAAVAMGPGAKHATADASATPPADATQVPHAAPPAAASLEVTVSVRVALYRVR